MDTFVMILTDIHSSDAWHQERDWLIGRRFTVRAGTLEKSSIQESGWFKAWCDLAEELPEELKEWQEGGFYFRAVKFEVVKD